MEDCNIHRTVDELGRIVIPREIRNKLGINEGDKLIVLSDSDDSITLKLPEHTDRSLYDPCDLCGHPESAIIHQGKVICAYCIRRKGIKV